MFRCIVVDDEPIIRSSVAKKIEEYGDAVAVVHLAADGEEALSWLEEGYADFCITDVKMPKINGLELIEAIKNNFPWMSSMVISSYGEFSYVQKSMQLDAIDYVLKPVDTAELHHMLDRAILDLTERRIGLADRLLLGKLPRHQDMLSRWNEHINGLQLEQLPILIVDTLEMLEGWVQKRHDLLPHLAVRWLYVVLETVAGREIGEEDMRFRGILREGREWTRYEARQFHRLGAIHQLEEGAARLAEYVRDRRGQQSSWMVAQVKKYIEEHYAEKITLQEVADAVGMSRTYLASLFKQETGMTILNYVTDVRLEKAREYLLHTSMKIYEITHAVGYEDNIHFSKLFKEKYGLGPMEYKRRIKS